MKYQEEDINQRSRKVHWKMLIFFSLIVCETKYKSIHGEVVKILNAKQMFQRLQTALAQVKAGNTSGNLLNDIRQIIYSLH